MIGGRFGIRFLSADQGTAVAELPLGEGDMNPYGIPYGGMMFNLADCTAGAALDSLDIAGMTVSAETRFLRGEEKVEKLVCRARVRKAGHSISFVDASVTDGEGLELSAMSFVFVNRR